MVSELVIDFSFAELAHSLYLLPATTRHSVTLVRGTNHIGWAERKFCGVLIRYSAPMTVDSQ